MNNSTVAMPIQRQLASTVIVCIVAGLCSLLTIFGNLFVILAFITNRSLRNFSNYLILNLAISDLIIGLFSMNIFTVYNINEHWTLGKGMCNVWLTVDYVVSNTSVMNLLIICIDRYTAITSPVKYRKRCTPKTAAFVICMAWIISFLLWAPAILLWDVISPPEDSGASSIQRGICSIPFMESSAAVTIITALAAFYLPAMAMCALYWRVIVNIERRTSRVSSMISRATTAIETRYTAPWTNKHRDEVQKVAEKDQNPTNKQINCENAIEAKDDDNLNLSSSRPDRKDIVALLKKASTKYDSNLQIKSSKRDSGSDKNSMTHLLKKEDTKSSSNAEISDVHSHTRSEEETYKNIEKLPLEIQSPEVQLKKDLVSKSNKNKKRPKKISSNLSLIGRKKASRLNRERRATTLLKSILICFISLWLPYNVFVVVYALCPACNSSAIMWNLSYWLCYLNSTVNPLCYGYCNENFQRTFKTLLTTKWWTKTGRRKMRCQLSSRNGSRRPV